MKIFYRSLIKETTFAHFRSGNKEVKIPKLRIVFAVSSLLKSHKIMRLAVFVY